MWRTLPSFVRSFFGLIFLDTCQGSTTSLAAAVEDFDDPSVLYLQPYWLPDRYKHSAPFPVYEMMGPFVGYKETNPRLPIDGGSMATQALFKVSEELTGCKFSQDC